ncbi:tape measure domain protein [Elizabethkingia phage TCUEAP3]|nr:tape measure domain protein [Elizabethkingia phage TCUEAP3]
MANDQINIEFILNTPALLEEYNKMIASGKNVDDSVDAIKKRYQELAAAQVLGVEGARDLADAVKNINTTVKDTNFDHFGLTKENIAVQKQAIKDIESEIKKLDKQISNTAPGVAQASLMSERNKIVAELEAEKQALSALEASIKAAESEYESFAKNQRDVNNELKQLAVNGQEGSDRYKELKEKAQEFKEASEKVNNDIKDGNTLLQGQVEGLNMLISTISVAQGVMALLGVEEENLQKIMLKVQSLLAITIGLQQISDALNKKSAFSTIVLAKAKEIWAAANLKVATSLGISTTAAQVFTATITMGLSVAIVALIAVLQSWQAAQARTAADHKKMTETIANSLADPIIQYQKMKTEWNALADDIKAKEQYIHDNAAAFEKLGVKVYSVSDAENLFVKNTSAFIEAMQLRARAAAELEIAQDKWKEYLTNYDKVMANNKRYNEATFGGVGRWAEKNILSPMGLGDKTVDDMNKIFQDQWKMINANIQHTQEAAKKLSDAGIKMTTDPSKRGTVQWLRDQISSLDKQINDGTVGTRALAELVTKREKLQKQLDAALGKKTRTKKERERQMAEIYPEGSIKDLERRISLYNEALDKIKDGQVKLQKIDQFGKTKDKKGNPYFTGEVVSEAEAKKRRDALEVELEEKKNAVKYKSFEEMVSAMESRWQKYYAYEKEYGSEAANKQFPELKKLAASYFDYLENQKSVFDNIVSSGNVLSEGQQKNLDLLNQKIKELRGDKPILENTTRSVEVALAKLPILADQISYLEKEITKAENDGQSKSNGVYAMLTGKWVEKKQELTNMVTEVINTHQSLQVKITEITSRYATLRQGIEKRKLSAQDAAKLLAELEKEKQQEIDAVQSAEYAKTTIYERYSQNLMGITKRELAIRIASLEEYLRVAKDSLSTEQQKFIDAEIKKAKALKTTFNVGVEEKSLLQEKERLIKSIRDKQAKGISDVKAESEALEVVNGKLKDILAKKAQMAANIAGAMASGFKAIAGSIDDTNEGLADTLNTLGDIMNIAQNAAGAFASFASGDIIGGISQTFNAIAGIFSLGKAARESERKAREEIKKYNDSIFQSGLDYNEMLRKRILDELKLNDVYKARIQNIKDEMAANTKNKESIIRDQEAVLKRLLNADTVVGMHTEKYGGFLGIGRKTRAVEDMAKVGDLLGLKGYKIDPFKGMSEFMKKFFGIKSPVNNDITETIGLTDELFDRLAKLNAEKPLTGDAKAAYEQLLKLREEYGSIEQMNRELEKQYKDTITGVTAQNIGDSIREGILSGKKSFADFADDIEDILRKGIIAGMEAKVIEPQMQKLQDALAEYLGDGVLTDDERKQFQEMYMKVAKEAKDYMDLINQSGINIGNEIGGANSLQGAYKAASEESITLLSGNTAGMRLAILEGNGIMKSGFAAMMEVASRQLAVQMDIEKNTRRTADNTEKLHDIDEGIDSLGESLTKEYKALQAAGIIK